MGNYQWATDYAERLDALDVARDELRESVGTHGEYLPTLKSWGELIGSLGVLRKGDGLRVELCYPSAEFFSHSSGGYCDGLYYVIIHRNGATSRATLRMRASIKADGGELSYFVDDDGTVRTARAYITETTLPDGARKLINDAINKAWDSLNVPIVSIWRECVGFSVRHELMTGRTWHARRIIADHGGF